MSKVLTDLNIHDRIKDSRIGIHCRIADHEEYKKQEYLKKYLGDKNGKIQPSSLDLSIGRIFRPNKLGDQESRGVLSEYEMKPGETVIVETLERITFDNQHSGIGFPLARVSGDAILMTNPGHIDPGYSGHLSFTLINMGRKDYILKRNSSIVTVIIFDLGRPVFKGFKRRRNDETASQKSYAKMLSSLAPDFGDFTQRMSYAARGEVEKATAEFSKTVEENKNIFKLWIVVATFCSSLLGFCSSNYFATKDFAKKSELQALDQHIDTVRDSRTLEMLQSDIQEMQKTILVIKDRVEQKTVPNSGTISPDKVEKK